jgi:hypothetical protein
MRILLHRESPKIITNIIINKLVKLMNDSVSQVNKNVCGMLVNYLLSDVSLPK